MTRILSMVAAAFLILACSADPGPRGLVAPGEQGNDTGTTDGSDTGGTDTTGEDPVVAGPNVLSFEKTTDASGQPCTNPCLEVLGAGITRDVAVLYKQEDGQPIAEAALTIETDAPDTVMSLTAKQVFTDNNGRAVFGLTALDGADGNYTVTIRAANDHEATALVLNVLFDIDLVPPLKVSVNYAGTQSIQEFEVALYLQEGGKPLCSDVHPDAAQPAPAVMVKPGLKLTGQMVIEGLPGLETAGAQQWMVAVRGPSGGSVAAHGCTSGVEVKFEETREVAVDVTDLPLLFGGTYDSTSSVDMHTGLPGTAGDVISLLVGLFTDPGKVALEAACKNAGGSLKTICGLITNGDGTLNSIGMAVAQVATEACFALAKEQIGEGVIFDGQSLAALLQKMRFGSILTLAAEPSMPDTTGMGGAAFAPEATSESWETVSYRWTFLQGCDPTDDESCWQTIKLVDLYGINLQAAGFGAGVTAKNELWIQKHAVPGFDYGVLVNFLVEKKILPLLFGDGSKTTPEGGQIPPIDSYDKIIATIFGDDLCLGYTHPDSNMGDCCWWFAQKDQVKEVYAIVPDNPFLSGEDLAIDACNAAIPAAANFIRGEVAKLGGTLNVGTFADQPCWAADQQGDRVVDNLGDKSNACVWDLTIEVTGGDFEPINSWHGLHK